MDCASVITHLERDLVVTVDKSLNISALRGRRAKLCIAKGKMDLWKAHSFGLAMFSCFLLLMPITNLL